MSLINTSHPSSQHIHTSPLSPSTSMPLLPLLLILLPRCYHYYYHYYYGLVQTERRWSPMGPRFLEEGVRTPQTKVNCLGSSPKPANPSLSSDPLHQQLVQQTLASPAFQPPCHLTPTFSHVFYFENFYKSTPNFATSVKPRFKKKKSMNYFDSMVIKHRIGKIARHKQQSLVERKNQQLGKMIFKRMTEEELLTGEPSTQWVDDLKGFVKEINDKIDKQRLKKENNNTTNKQTKKKERDINAYKCEGDACEILTEGQKVRVVLEYPRNVHDSSRLMGKFRDGDIRWEVKPRIIKQVIIEPNQPPMYLVSMIDDETQTDRSCAYTKNELLPVKENEIAPREEMIRPTKKGKKELCYVEKIVDKKKEKNRFYYLIKYKGIKEPSWEPKTELIKFIPDMIDEYEEKND